MGFSSSSSFLENQKAMENKTLFFSYKKYQNMSE
jgi:hypothetical protein